MGVTNTKSTGTQLLCTVPHTHAPPCPTHTHAPPCPLTHWHTQEVSPSSVLRLNEAYSNKRTKFKITAAAQKEAPQVRGDGGMVWRDGGMVMVGW